MQLSQFICINVIVVTLFSFCVNSAAVDEPAAEMLRKARKQFHAAIEDKKQIEPTMALFKEIAQAAPEHAGRTQVYIGALFALRGKHAFFPYTKLKWARRGLAMMDSGLKKSPNDIEALFIHGATCYHLPFFFRRGDDAQRDFRKIVKLMPEHIDAYDPKLIKNVVVFLLENAKLTDDEKAYLKVVSSVFSGK